MTARHVTYICILLLTWGSSLPAEQIQEQQELSSTEILDCMDRQDPSSWRLGPWAHALRHELEENTDNAEAITMALECIDDYSLGNWRNLRSRISASNRSETPITHVFIEGEIDTLPPYIEAHADWNEQQEVQVHIIHEEPVARVLQSQHPRISIDYNFVISSYHNKGKRIDNARHPAAEIALKSTLQRSIWQGHRVVIQWKLRDEQERWKYWGCFVPQLFKQLRKSTWYRSWWQLQAVHERPEGSYLLIRRGGTHASYDKLEELRLAEWGPWSWLLD